MQGVDVGALVFNARYLARMLFSSSFVYPLLGRATLRPGRGLVTEKSEIVIEGFPRSGNSFAVRAFLQAQGRSCEIAHHFHSSSQVLRGVKLGVPTLVLIRSPIQAVASYALRRPELSLRFALLEYCRFYSVTQKVRSQCVVADFQEVITDFGAVIERLNIKYGTCFKKFKHDEDSCAKILEESVAENLLINKNNSRVDDMVSAPSEKKETRKKEIFKRLSEEKYKKLVSSAEEIYRSFL